MKNPAQKLFKTTICILLIMSLCGCWNRRELDTLAVVMGVGIDKSMEPEKIQITAQLVKAGEIKPQNKGVGSYAQAFWNVSATGDTVFGTIRDITKKSNRKLFFPHNQVLIFDKSLAEEGIQNYIDFFNRDPKTRVNVLVLISQGPAMEVLGVKSELEKFPANNIAKLVKVHADATSQTRAVKLRDLSNWLMSKTTASTVPFIKITRDDDIKIATISGTAVFKGDKLVGNMDNIEGRGLMWVLGEVKSGIIKVADSANNKVNLEIVRASSKMVPEINNNKITIKVNINEEGNLGEQTGSENLSKLAAVEYLEKQKAEVIRSEVMAAVRKAQELDADVFGFGEAVHKKYPKQWNSLEDNWDEIFKGIEVEVEVKAKLRLMGRIIKPSVPAKEK
jgi:spore germination protein KC